MARDDRAPPEGEDPKMSRQLRVEPPRVGATRHAALAALGYAMVAGSYIVLSGEIAEQLAETVGHLSRLEVIKGLAFVLVTSLGLFFLIRRGFLRVANQAMHLEQSQAAFAASERRATAARFAASIAHDFNNVLTVMNGSIDELRYCASDEERALLIAELEEASLRAQELTTRLFKVVRDSGEEDSAEDVDVFALVEETLDSLARRVLRTSRPRLVGSTSLVARLYPTLVRQIVVNLVLNARDATEGKGRIEVEVSRFRDEIRIAVDDDGPGVPERLRSRIFEAFFTTKEAGTGLGLLSVRTCAERHGGCVEVGASRLGGARFRVRLGEVPPAVVAEAKKTAAAS